MAFHIHVHIAGGVGQVLPGCEVVVALGVGPSISTPSFVLPVTRTMFVWTPQASPKQYHNFVRCKWCFWIGCSLLFTVLFKQTLPQVIVFQTTTLFLNYFPFSSHFPHFPFQAALDLNWIVIPPIMNLGLFLFCFVLPYKWI